MIIQIERARGPKSLDAAIRNLERNLGPRELRKGVKAAWQAAGPSMAKGISRHIPEKATPYLSSHVNYWRRFGRRSADGRRGYRKAGDLRRSVKFFHAKRVGAEALPRAYVRIETYPLNFLDGGTVERKHKSGKSVGAVRNMINKAAISGVVSRAYNLALTRLLKSQNLQQPLK